MTTNSFSASAIFIFLVTLTAAQRLLELRRAIHNRIRMKREGFVRSDSPVAYRVMKSLHIFWLTAMVFEHYYAPWLVPRELYLFAIAAFLVAQVLRYAAIKALGGQWNTQIMSPRCAELDPGVVCSGPYRYIRHPNYTAVIIEMFSLPLVGGAVYTSIVAGLVNLLVILNRIEAEEAELFKRVGYATAFKNTPRFLPKVTKGR